MYVTALNEYIALAADWQQTSELNPTATATPSPAPSPASPLLQLNERPDPNLFLSICQDDEHEMMTPMTLER